MISPYCKNELVKKTIDEKIRIQNDTTPSFILNPECILIKIKNKNIVKIIYETVIRKSKALDTKRKIASKRNNG